MSDVPVLNWRASALIPWGSEWRVDISWDQPPEIGTEDRIIEWCEEHLGPQKTAFEDGCWYIVPMGSAWFDNEVAAMQFYLTFHDA